MATFLMHKSLSALLWNYRADYRIHDNRLNYIYLASPSLAEVLWDKRCSRISIKDFTPIFCTLQISYLYLRFTGVFVWLFQVAERVQMSLERHRGPCLALKWQSTKFLPMLISNCIHKEVLMCTKTLISALNSSWQSVYRPPTSLEYIWVCALWLSLPLHSCWSKLWGVAYSVSCTGDWFSSEEYTLQYWLLHYC